MISSDVIDFLKIDLFLIHCLRAVFLGVWSTLFWCDTQMSTKPIVKRRFTKDSLQKQTYICKDKNILILGISH